jgi:hypothetical protein
LQPDSPARIRKAKNFNKQKDMMQLYAWLRRIEEVFSYVVTGGSGGEWVRMLGARI